MVITRGRAAMNTAMNHAADVVTADTPVAEVVALRSAVRAHTTTCGLMGAMAVGTQYGHHPLPHEVEIEAAWDRGPRPTTSSSVTLRWTRRAASPAR